MENSPLVNLNQPGREIHASVLQLLQALLNQYPGMGAELSAGITITVRNPTKILFEMTGQNEKRNGLILAIAGIFSACNQATAPTPEPSPVGNWAGTATFSGITVLIQLSYTEHNYIYQGSYQGQLIVYRSGTWTRNGKELALKPVTCQGGIPLAVEACPSSDTEDLAGLELNSWTKTTVDNGEIIHIVLWRVEG
jgi:hypothetical protein